MPIMALWPLFNMMMDKSKYSWVDRNEYPFKSRWIELPLGLMHYVDEGQGDTLLFIHGNPVWSFTFRKLIRELSSHYRCVAIDHFGFGLSDKPTQWSYLPEDHEKNLTIFINKMGLTDITLFVNDWGGPIGLSYAVNHPNNISRLVIFNTFMWPVNGDKHYDRFSAFMGGGIGRFLNLYFNFFGNVVMKLAYGDKKKLTHHARRQLLLPHSTKAERKGVWIFPREIIHSTQWLQTVWQKRKTIEDVPALILWGMKDIAFRRKELETFKSFLKNTVVIELPETGHYVQDESAEIILQPIFNFLQIRKPIL